MPTTLLDRPTATPAQIDLADAMIPDGGLEGAVRELVVLAAMTSAGVTPTDPLHQGLLDLLGEAAEKVRNMLGGYTGLAVTERIA